MVTGLIQYSLAYSREAWIYCFMTCSKQSVRIINPAGLKNQTVVQRTLQTLVFQNKYKYYNIFKV